MTHLMWCHEQKFSTGTWSGAVLTRFTVKCGECSGCFVVTRDVIEMGASIFSVRSVRDLICPYCGANQPTKADQEQILETHVMSDD